MWKIGKPKIDEPDAAENRQRELETRRSRQDHALALADLSVERTVARLAQRSRKEDAVGAAELAALYRTAEVSGTRASVAHDILNSGEVRALRVAKVRKASLAILLPVLTAFAAWSTVGVHHGVVKLFHANPGDSTWTAAWGVEPALIAIVALIIIVKAILRTANGELDWRATAIEFTALGASIMLNLAGAWPENFGWATLPALIGHSVGPLGCAGTALLISIIDDGVANARPWQNAPRLVSPTRLTEMADSRLTETPKAVSPTRAETPKTVSQVRLTETADVETVEPKPESTEAKRARIIAAFETERDAGRPHSYADIAAVTNVPKPTVGRYLAKHLKPNAALD